MDAKTLAKIIQLVVKEEVTKIVKKEMTILKKEVITEIRKTTPKQRIVETSPTPSNLDDIVSNVLADERRQPTTKKNNSGGTTAIEDILNETKGFNQREEYDEYPTMGKPMQASDAPGVGNYRDMMSREMGIPQPGQGKTTAQEMLPDTDINGRPMNKASIPDPVAKALTRDYSDLMKKMNLKK